ncbi:uncharacterized protein VP01_6032g2 [Puccinia sorghi]|uniref:Uncharacterized protein n=1 Tax=Puccinia sorghi TaxID=27349 RepID=A0A0L6UHB2_9BASI|nr:uncharacterized protein VP01_6032g2 [Puccinia sorghi]
MVMEQLFSVSRICCKLDTEQSTCTLRKSSKQSTSCNHNWHHGQNKKNNQKPPIDGNHYYNCKKRYSISLTLVFDVNKKFTSYLADCSAA